MMYNCNNHKTIFSHNKGVPVANSIHHSNSIYNYFKSLKLGLFLSDVYLNHLMIIMVSVFLRGYRGKTIDFAEVSCMHRTTTAYFLNHGKWDDSALQDILKARVIHTIYQEAYRSGKPIFCIVDDTIASHTKPSSQALHPIEAAYFHQSHLKRHQDYGHQVVSVMLSCNGIILNYAVILYDRSKSKIQIVQEIAQELPVAPVVSYFLCDSWYTSVKVMGDVAAYIDDLYFDGKPDYRLDFGRMKLDSWHVTHQEVPQFAKLKGHSYLDGQYLSLSCADFAEMYTGHHLWNNYRVTAVLKPVTSTEHFVNIRVQGAMRSYAAGFSKNNKLVLRKNYYGYITLCETDFEWKVDEEYKISLTADGSTISVSVNDKEYLKFTDSDLPLLTGCAGISVEKGSHCLYRDIAITGRE